MVGCINYCDAGIFLCWHVICRFYESVSAGKTILQDIIVRPGVALSMLIGFVCGIVAFFTGIIGIIRKKDHSVLVFLSTAMGFLMVLWCLAEILFPH